MSSTAQSPNFREILSARSTVTGKQEYLTSTNGYLNINATIIPSGIQAVNMTQLNGVAASAGNGTADTGTQRVTIASDSTGQISIRGKYNTTKPTYTDGQTGDVQIGTRGALSVQIFGQDSTNAPAVLTAGSDASSNVVTSLAVTSYPKTFNGTTFDRQYSVANATNSTGTGIAAAGLVAQLDDTSPTTITENQFGNLRMSADRSLLMAMRAVTPTQTSVAGSASTTTLLAANAARKGATVFNDSSAVLYLKLGATASTTSYTTQLASNAYYEVPFGYIGVIDGIWASATGNARVTEIV